MQYEYLVLFVVLVMTWQNFSLRRKIKQLWQAMDKSKYIARYTELVHQHKDQMKAVKSLRQEFSELNLLQAVEVSKFAHHQMDNKPDKS
ncbi:MULTISPECIES: hypothetical protein [unclassified Moraxella]|uniref:hypothetical protein n=1 Tax=unclassified Moraxella TaxID=2685852 RepID=UPI002B4097CA|nr:MULTISPECIES: hypothetical protein [unclassified Moraxella]